MIKKIRSILLKLTVGALLVAPVGLPAVAYAQDQVAGGLNCGSNFDVSTVTPTTGCATPSDGTGKVNNLIKLGINIFSLVVGIIAVVMIIVGGLKYITSGGDSGNITGAKNTIIYAIVGLVVVALAQFIVHFVLEKTATA